MNYVLDKIKECIYRKDKKKCDLQCEKCQYHMNTNNTLEALDRITNLLDNIGNSRTRKNW